MISPNLDEAGKMNLTALGVHPGWLLLKKIIEHNIEISSIELQNKDYSKIEDFKAQQASIRSFKQLITLPEDLTREDLHEEIVTDPY